MFHDIRSQLRDGTELQLPLTTLTSSTPLALHQRADPVAPRGEEPLLLLLGVAQEVAVAVGDEDAQRDELQHGRRQSRSWRVRRRLRRHG